MEDEQEAASKTEEAASTQAEGTKTTETEEKSTVDVTKTPEFKAALDTAVGKGVSSIQSQLSISKAEAKAAKAETVKFKTESAARQAHIQNLTREAEVALVDDPEKRQAYISRISSLEREQKLAEKDADAEAKLLEAEKLSWAGAMALKSIALKEKYQVPQEVLDTCITEEQMETVASAFPEVKTKEPKKEEEPPKFAGAGEGGGGKDLNSLSSTELIQRGVQKMTKK